MKFKNLIIICCSLVSYNAFAGQGWNVTITNNAPWPVTISNSGTDCWYAKDLDGSHTIQPGASQGFYTEQKNSGGCYIGFPVYSGDGSINLSVSDQRTNASVQIKGSDDCHISSNNSAVTTSVNCNGATPYSGHQASANITINPPGSPLNFQIKTIGNLGKVFESACGQTLLLAPISGKPYIDCTNAGTDVTNTLRITFSNTAGWGCNVLVDQSGNIKSTTCDHTSIGYTYDTNHDVIFACQQASNGESACPWLFKKGSGDVSSVGNIYNG
ncbi:hypothetical protein L3V83_09450 [Thiotrichales bacterium 19X7-9]|nr:hypothetical protein [Thiotrichales bacterium 19X7-9]